MRQILIITVFVLCFSGCASSGVKVDQAKLAAFKKGETTYADVLQSLGAPTQSTITDDGSRRAIYHYFGYQSHPENFIPIVGPLVGGADTESTFVMMTFDKNGILQGYTASEAGSGSGRNFESLSQRRKDVREVQ